MYTFFAVTLLSAFSLAADSRDLSVSFRLPPDWSAVDDPGAIFSARPTAKGQEAQSLGVYRLVRPAGVTLKDFAFQKHQEFKEKAGTGPGPSPSVKIVEIRKGLPPSYSFITGDLVRRYQLLYFEFDGLDYSTVCSAERAKECLSILSTASLPKQKRRHTPQLGSFSVELPPGWSVLQDSPADFELSRPQGQSIYLKASDIAANAPLAPLEQELAQTLTKPAPDATVSKLTSHALPAKQGKAVWVQARRRQGGTLLSGVVWAGKKSYRLAIVSAAPSGALAQALLSSWRAEP